MKMSLKAVAEQGPTVAYAAAAVLVVAAAAVELLKKGLKRRLGVVVVERERK